MGSIDSLAEGSEPGVPRRRRRWVFAGIIAILTVLGVIAYAIWPQHGVRMVNPLTPNPSAEVTIEDTPQPDVPLTFQDVPPETAQALNAARPDYIGSIVMARPFTTTIPGLDDGSRMRALDCLTAAIYYEARSESPQGQRAVAQVVLNRARDPLYPNSVCGVVFQGAARTTGCQFSFTCDGSLAVRPIETIWQRTRAVAQAALNGLVEPSVGLATHYHTQWVVPVWRTDLVKLRTIGAHIFYGWKGRANSGHGLRPSYAGTEPPHWPSFAAYAVTPSDMATLPMGADGGSFAAMPQAAPDPLAAAGQPLTKPAIPIRADESRGALVTQQSQLKIDEQPVPLSQLSDALPK